MVEQELARINSLCVSLAIPRLVILKFFATYSVSQADRFLTQGSERDVLIFLHGFERGIKSFK